MQTEPSASKKDPNPLTNDILAAFVMIRHKASLAAVQKPQHFIKVFINNLLGLVLGLGLGFYILHKYKLFLR